VAESGFRAPATYQKLKVSEKHRPLSGHMRASSNVIVDELPMKSCNDERPDGSERLGGGAIRLIALILVFGASAVAQSVPASISTIQQPSIGHPVFDASGNTYYLSGPPMAGAAQTQAGGGLCIGEAGGRIGVVPCPAASVIKVDPSGNQIWGTLLGGPGPDNGTALAIDANGNVALTGSTSGQFPTTPGAAIGSSTSATVFAAKVTADGSKFLYSTYLPDSDAASSAIAVDAAGSAYIAGKTSAGHAFVLKLSADGSTISYNVTLAGSGADAATAIAVDAAGNAFVAGQTTSPDFPVTAGAFQQQLKGTRNSFLVRLDPSGNVLSSTYFGGSGSDNPSSIAIDGAGNIDLVGSTSSLDLPTTQGVMQPSAIVPPWNDFAPAGFVAQFAPDGISLKWASYVMSSDLGSRLTAVTIDVGVSALAVGPAGDIYIGGLTGPGFPVTPSAPVICFQGSTNRTNGFLAHLNANGALLDATYLGNDVESVGGLLPLAGGSALIAWHGSGNDVVSKVQFGSGGWTAPACLSTDVLNSATLDGSSGIAPGELMTLTGFGIGPDIGAVYQPDAQGNVPTQLAGVQVLFDGAPMPVLYAQSRQINAIAPVGLGTIGTPHNVTVTYNNQQFGPAFASAIFGSPGIFRLQIGQSAQAAAINQDGTLNGPMNPAARGSVVAVWGTGYGQTNPPCPIGGLNVPDAVPLSPGVSALIYYVDPNSGLQLAPVQYAGSAPTLVCGIVQINFQVPMNVAPGAFSFSPAIGENGTIQALTSATIAVK
jgi:uncharacterized protein (TIGR03437 family)